MFFQIFKFSLVPWIISISSNVIFKKSNVLVHAADFSQIDLEGFVCFCLFVFCLFWFVCLLLMNEKLGWGIYVAVLSFLCGCVYLYPHSLWRMTAGLGKWAEAIRKQAPPEGVWRWNPMIRLGSSQFYRVFSFCMDLPKLDQVPKLIICFH